MADQIFDITYSLPTLAHSVAIATRCLTDGRQRRYPTKYMPDFGGVLDIPQFVLKNNGLSSGIPFGKRPCTSSVQLPASQDTQVSPTTNDCLVVNSYLKTIDNDDFVVIRALGNTVDFNLIKQATVCDAEEQSITYTTIPYSQEITGIKYLEKTPNFLFVKFDQEVKTLQLNDSYTVGTARSEDELPSINLKACLSRNDGYLIKDTCLNQHNLSWQAIACDDCQNGCRLELYDISTDAKTPFQTFNWSSQESKPLTVESRTAYVNNKMVGGTSIRTMIPSSMSKGVQHLEKIPNHRVNYLVTTGYQTCLIDPRCNEVSLVVLDKTQLVSFYPVEYCRSTTFSELNEYQFYSLSNISLRPMDIRYPGAPMNQVNHMLESSDYDCMSLKLIKHPASSRIETLCASSTEGICFLSFDQSQDSKFINPKSLHQPYHDITSNKSDSNMHWMHGLDVMMQTVEDEDPSFSIFQLKNNCDLYRRVYSFNQSHNEDAVIDTILNNGFFTRPSSKSGADTTGVLRLEEDGRDASPKVSRAKPKQTSKVLDILDEDECQEENLPSRAALVRFEAMMERLRKT